MRNTMKSLAVLLVSGALFSASAMAGGISESESRPGVGQCFSVCGRFG
ncbi:hypothetical protein P4W15_14335 [Morganella morganii]|nr:hypothetical protein [Morganella morganii]